MTASGSRARTWATGAPRRINCHPALDRKRTLSRPFEMCFGTLDTDGEDQH